MASSEAENTQAQIPLHPPSRDRRLPDNVLSNPLPQLIQTPSGLALLELQGTINLPDDNREEAGRSADDGDDDGGAEVPIGRLEFPDYDFPDGQTTTTPKGGGEGEGKWMKRVWMWVGRYQRLQGEVKKLPQAVAVVRRREKEHKMDEEEDGEEAKVEELEVVEIVRYKIVFGQRPEPVTGGEGGGEQHGKGEEMDLDE